jgi:L-fuculose-phosphate aldolase
MSSELQIRQEIIATCLRMNAEGLNVGSSGNLSVRVGDGFLITPSGISYDKITPDMIVAMDMAGRYYGDYIPSSEWRFHYDILKARPDVNVVLHSHAVHCAILASTRRDIPAIHYMIGVAGGSVVKCSGYAPFGTQALSQEALAALEDRMACLLGNHGIIALGKTQADAFHVLQEIENLARIYIGTLQIGGGVVLGAPEMDTVLQRFKTYGKQLGDIDPAITERVEPPVHGGKHRA